MLIIDPFLTERFSYLFCTNSNIWMPERKYSKSSRINTAMAINGLTTLLIARLDHQDAIARLILLKLIKVCYLNLLIPFIFSSNMLRCCMS